VKAKASTTQAWKSHGGRLIFLRVLARFYLREISRDATPTMTLFSDTFYLNTLTMTISFRMSRGERTPPSPSRPC
jgi:hypothetical protein